MRVLFAALIVHIHKSTYAAEVVFPPLDYIPDVCLSFLKLRRFLFSRAAAHGGAAAADSAGRPMLLLYIITLRLFMFRTWCFLQFRISTRHSSLK